MIVLTRLNGQKMVVNSDLIKVIEKNPDTTITLINGDHLLVAESLEEVVAKAIEYGRQLRVFNST